MIELDPIYKALKLLKDCIKDRKLKNKNAFTEYLEPAYTEINLVHKNYLESFLKYELLIEKIELPFDMNHPVFSEIENDSILSSDMRDRLYSAYDYADNKFLESFFQKLMFYFMEYYETFPLKHFGEPRSNYLQANVPRAGLFLEFKYIATKTEFEDIDKKKLAKKILKEQLNSMINDYREIVNEYQIIKKELI